MYYSSTPEPPLEPPEEPIAAVCSKCQGEIYPGEVCGEIAGRLVCIDCVEDEWNDLSDFEKIARFDYEPVTAESRPKRRRSF
jgi:hypothetical protein